MSRQGRNVFDWNEFWEGTGEERHMREGAVRMAGWLSNLIDDIGARTVADFGCGSGCTLMMLAGNHSSVELRGYDHSKSAVRSCSSEARRTGLKNVSFAVDALPCPRHRGRFDLVFSIATLHYVLDIRSAVRELYSMVLPGGALVFNYPNRYTMHGYKRWVKGEGRGQEERFHLVLSGQNLLTRRDIEDVLGRRTESFWAFVDEPPAIGNPCVLVRKPSGRSPGRHGRAIKKR